MTRVAAVLVTCNSARWIEQTLASIRDQTRQPDQVVIIDDLSTDATRAIVDRVLGSRAQVFTSRSVAQDRSTRIADNFRLGVQHARTCDVAILGDHDDTWHPQRIAHQVDEMLGGREMVASDGCLVDAAGVSRPGTLRSAFPVPPDFNSLPPAQRMQAVLRSSVATGGASAVRPEAFADLPIPPGWLHDRWWSLVATAREALHIDDTVVIDYRVSPSQEVGLDRGHQSGSALARLAVGLGDPGRSVRRVRDLLALRRLATSTTAPELAPQRMLRTLL